METAYYYIYSFIFFTKCHYGFQHKHTVTSSLLPCTYTYIAFMSEEMLSSIRSKNISYCSSLSPPGPSGGLLQDLQGTNRVTSVQRESCRSGHFPGLWLYSESKESALIWNLCIKITDMSDLQDVNCTLAFFHEGIPGVGREQALRLIRMIKGQTLLQR